LIFEAQNTQNVFTHCATNVPANDYTAPYGLLLLSRHNLSNITVADFLNPPFLTYLPRGYIAAEVCELVLDFTLYTQCYSVAATDHCKKELVVLTTEWLPWLQTN